MSEISETWWRKPRWRYAGAAFLLGVVESSVAVGFGFEARLGERDVTLVTGLLVELSFAVFGYLIGVAVEARRRERAAAAREAAQLRALGQAQARLAQSEKLASLGQLASAIAHEVRNPLAILRSQLQNLLEELPDVGEEQRGEGARATCARMIEEIDRLAHVTATLVDFASPLSPRRRRVAVAAVIERTRQLAARLLEERPVRLEVAPPSGADPELDADPDLLCQLLLGLLENAAEVSPDGTAIRLAWRSGAMGSAEMVELEVVDSGPGVPSELRERIFEPFFTTRAGGHGLGLAVARQIAEAHGGTIVVGDAEQGPGASFVIRLPAAEASAGAALGSAA